MKNILLLLPLILTSCFEESTVNQLQIRDSVSYAINKEKPFSGKLIKHWPNGQKKNVANYKNGVLHGTSFSWKEDGGKDIEAVYKNGLIDGTLTLWYFEMKAVGHYKDGKEDGLLTSWLNKQKVSEINFENGIQQGLSTMWNAKGIKTAETTYKNDLEHGISTMWYESGAKELEVTYKNGKKHGLYTSWHENGIKAREANYKNDLEHGISTMWDSNGQKRSETIYKSGSFVSFMSWNELGSEITH